jgi:flavin reductase (DIM6/NTAB) family NADH-FMN oxidoreductase RutF
MPVSPFKCKDYEVHAITAVAGDRINGNIATWVMQSAMKGRYLSVALYKPDYTLELVRESGVLNVNLLQQAQKNLINRFGRKSGRDYYKFNRLPYALDQRGCPYLTEAVAWWQCCVFDWADSGDHWIAVCEVLAGRWLQRDAPVMTVQWLRQNGYVRG